MLWGKVVAVERSPNDYRITIGEAFGINDSGEVVGVLDWRGFSMVHGRVTELQPLSTHGNGNGTRATGVNNHGQICGASTVNSGKNQLAVHAGLWSPSGGPATDLGTLPGLPHSIATAINDSTQVVGYSAAQTDGDTPQRFAWEAGRCGSGFRPGPGCGHTVICRPCQPSSGEATPMRKRSMPEATSWSLRGAPSYGKTAW